MSGPFVRAVTKAIRWGTDHWALEYYRDGGAYEQNRARTFDASQRAAYGYAWTESINLTHAIDHGYTALATFRAARKAMHECLTSEYLP